MKPTFEIRGEKEYENRLAKVYMGHTVVFYEYRQFMKKKGSYLCYFVRRIDGHTERYVEDCAENWVNGVINIV